LLLRLRYITGHGPVLARK